jgi:hypothetical protein
MRRLQIAWNKGLTKETDKRIFKQANKLKTKYKDKKLTCGFKKGNKNWKLRKKDFVSENNSNWGGDSVGYSGVHSWVRRRKTKPKYCEYCNERYSMDLSNISGKYERDVNDFEWLCRRCHMKKDGRYMEAINNLKNAKKRRGKNGRYTKIKNN